MKRILVPTDFSPASRLAVTHALEVADAVEAELLILHVIDEECLVSPDVRGIRELFAMTVDPTGSVFSYEAVQEAAYHDLCEEAEWKLRAMLPPFGSERLRTQVVVGKTAGEILRVAVEEKASLIIMGIHGKPGWRHLFLESTAEKVIQQSAIPVITLWIPREAVVQGRPVPHVALSTQG
jgi:nucleotide-binding universal stress UspA family protein